MINQLSYMYYNLQTDIHNFLPIKEFCLLITLVLKQRRRNQLPTSMNQSSIQNRVTQFYRRPAKSELKGMLFGSGAMMSSVSVDSTT